MPGKKGAKALREEGLQKTDNDLDLTTWPQVQMINQKNYYTEYLKRDDQYLAWRTLQEENTNRMVKEARDRDRTLAQTSTEFTTNGAGAGAQNGDDEMDLDEEDEKEPHGSKIIVIHPGSQNLRIGFANDALPKTIPMCIARKWKTNESEEDGGEPSPKRVKIDNEEPEECEKLFGDDFAKQYTQMSTELKNRMRNNKRRLLPNSKDLVINYHKRTSPETIPEHNDPQQIDWTEINAKSPDYFIGQAALRIPEKSRPRYKLFWPLRLGWMNEKSYSQQNLMWTDFFKIIEEAIKTQLGLTDTKEWSQYSCVFAIPDLYERIYVTKILDVSMREWGFRRISFMQESLAASFGAGYSMACIVDIGAQKTSVCCVEDGMCLEESRMNLKYGGWDTTELFIKMMLFDYFPYADINLRRRYDFIVAEELKQKFCTMNEAEISVQLYEFHLRASGQDTRKYTFKTYDETMLAPMAYFNPQIFDHTGKLASRRRILDRSYDLYDNTPNDPISIAQSAALQYSDENIPSAVLQAPPQTIPLGVATPNGKPQSFNLLSRPQFAGETTGTTPRDSVASSPAPEGTPAPQTASEPGANPDPDSDPPPTRTDPALERIRAAEQRDRTLPLLPLDLAIRTSIREAAKNDDRKARDFYSSIMLVGGGAKFPGFNSFLETKLKEALPGVAKEILIGLPPRELDQQLVTWKGGSVFGRLSSSGNDSWVYGREYELLGAKLLAQKCMWNW